MASTLTGYLASQEHVREAALALPMHIFLALLSSCLNFLSYRHSTRESLPFTNHDLQLEGDIGDSKPRDGVLLPLFWLHALFSNFRTPAPFSNLQISHTSSMVYRITG